MGVCHHPNAHERGPRRVSGPSRRKFGDKKLEPKVLIEYFETRSQCDGTAVHHGRFDGTLTKVSEHIHIGWRLLTVVQALGRAHPQAARISSG